MSDDRQRTVPPARAASPPRPAPSGRRAFDPFFVFTYSLLALAGAIQLFLIIWLDLF